MWQQKKTEGSGVAIYHECDTKTVNYGTEIYC